MLTVIFDMPISMPASTPWPVTSPTTVPMLPSLVVKKSKKSPLTFEAGRYTVAKSVHGLGPADLQVEEEQQPVPSRQLHPDGDALLRHASEVAPVRPGVRLGDIDDQMDRRDRASVAVQRVVAVRELLHGTDHAVRRVAAELTHHADARVAVERNDRRIVEV